MAWLAGYAYRKDIIEGGAIGAGSDYQISLKVGESATSPDADLHIEQHALDFPNDIRFTNDDELTELPYWLEKVEGVSPNRTAYFWIKVNTNLDVSKTIYVYYNRSIGSTSDGEATFISFENFTTNLSKWVVDQLGIAVIGYNALKISAGAIPWQSILHSIDTFNPQNKAIETNVKMSNESADGILYINSMTDNANKYVSRYSFSTAQLWDISTYGYMVGASVGISQGYDSIYAQDEWHRFSFKKDGGTTLKLTDVNDPSIELVSTHDSFDDLVNNNVSFATSGTVMGDYYVDWIALRKYVSPEPYFDSAGPEETYPYCPNPIASFMHSEGACI